MKKAIVFDLDGTLADTIADITDGLNGMLTEYGLPTVTCEQTLQNINNGAMMLVRRSLPEDKRDDEFVKQAKMTYEKYYSKCYNNKTSEYPGCTEALKSLNAQGISLSVLSNKQDEFVKKIIQRLFPDIKFDFVMGQSDCFPTKPDPAALNYILEKIGVRPDEAVFVGDSNIDMQTAINANVFPYGVSWGYRSEQILLENGAKVVVGLTSSLANIPNVLI